MSNPVIAAAKLTHKRNALTEMLAELNEAEERSDALLREIDESTTEEELDVVEKSVQEIKEEIKSKEDEKSKLEEEIQELEKSLEETNEKAPDKNQENNGGQRKMTKTNEEFRTAIKGYVRSKGEERAGFTTVEGGVLIPDGSITTPQEKPETVVDLRKVVNVVPVTTGAGTYPVLGANKDVMISVAELAKNPELAKPTFIPVDYKVETFRGYIPVSQEVIDDADYNVEGLIAKHIDRQSLNTSNAKIASVLKTFTAKAASNLDDLKSIVNVDLDPAYNTKFVLSQSLFNEVDKMKDNNGRYLLQQDVTVQSGYKLFGREVIVLADNVIGAKAGDMVGFIGDLDTGVTFFDRKQVTVKWTDNDVYGQLLAGFVRFDAKKADADSGFYVTFAALPEA